MLAPDEIEYRLANIGASSKSPADALCLSISDEGEALEGIRQLENYVMRHLRQSLPEIETWTWEEAKERFDDLIVMIRAENGRKQAFT